MKTGLILEGGAMRGLFSAGIMDVMMENGIAYDGVIGVSAVRISVTVVFIPCLQPVTSIIKISATVRFL